MFDPARFIADCRAARAQDPTHKSVVELVTRAVSDPTAGLKGLGEPTRSTVDRLYHDDTLTVLNVVWGPGLIIYPHNHNMWAVIGIYTGREDNIYWRRLPGGRVAAAGARALCAKDVEPLGANIIHSVTNPIPRLTGAIHVYGGDLYGVPGRSEWDAETLQERPYDVAKGLKLFDDANAR